MIMHFTDFFFNAINGLAGKFHTLDILMITISKTIPYILMAITVISYFYSIKSKDKELRLITVDTVVKTAFAYIISQIIGGFIYFPRPFEALESSNALYYHESNSSFPSDHSLGCMSLALGLSKFKHSLGKVYIALAVLTGISRVYVGHHFPLDIIGGFIIAFVVGKLYDRYIKEFINKLYIAVESHTPILNKLT